MFSVRGYTVSRDERSNGERNLLIRQGRQAVTISVEQLELFIEHIREAANQIDPVIAVIPPEDTEQLVRQIPR